MNPLEIPSDEFERLCLPAARISAEYLESLRSRPAFPATSGEGTERMFRQPWEEQGLGAEALDSVRDIFQHSRPPSPGFFGYVFGSGEPVAAIGDLLASVVNQNVTAWRSAPAAVAIEKAVVSWLADAVGCAGFSGSLCGGGSAANLMGLAMAREGQAPANVHGAQPGVVYASEEIHMSVQKAVALLGLGTANLGLGRHRCALPHASRGIGTRDG